MKESDIIWIRLADKSGLSPEAFAADHPDLPFTSKTLRTYLKYYRKTGKLPMDKRTMVQTRRRPVLVPLLMAIIREVFLLECVKEFQMSLLNFFLAWAACYYPEHVPARPNKRSVELSLARMEKKQEPETQEERTFHHLAQTIVQQFVHLACFKANWIWAFDSECLSARKQQLMRIRIVSETGTTIEPWILRLICAGTRVVLAQIILPTRPRAENVIELVHVASQEAGKIYHRQVLPTFLRMDRAGEHLRAVSTSGLRHTGVQVQLTPPGTPCLNGVCERVHQTLGALIRGKNRPGSELITDLVGMREMLRDATADYHHRPHRAFKGKLSPAQATARLPKQETSFVGSLDSFLYLDSRPLTPRDGVIRYHGRLIITTVNGSIIVRDYVAGSYHGRRELLLRHEDEFHLLPASEWWETQTP